MWVALLVVSAARTFVSTAVFFAAVAATFAKRAGRVTEALRQAEVSLTAATPFTSTVYHALAKEVVNAGCNLVAMLVVSQPYTLPSPPTTATPPSLPPSFLVLLFPHQ